MNGFVNFKNFLRSVRKEFESHLEYFNNQLDMVNEILDNWDSVEIKPKKENMTFRDKINMTLRPKSYKNAHFIALIRDKNYFISQKQFLEDKIFQLKLLVASFDNEKTVRPINDLPFLIFLLMQAIMSGYIDIAEADKILGSAIYFDNVNKRKCNITDLRVSSLVEKLAQFFDKYGNFVLATDSSYLKTLLELLIKTDADLEKYENTAEVEKAKSKEFIEGTGKLYDDFVKTYEPTKREDTPLTLNKPSYKYLRELKRYYKNGKLVSIPNDLERFSVLLDNCMLSDGEKRYILNLVNQTLEEEKMAFSLGFTLREKYVYDEAKRLLEQIDSFGEDAKTINDEFLRLSYLDKSNPLYEQEKSQIFNNLQFYLDKYTEDKTSNNLVFLSDENGNAYFNSDLENIDKGLRKAAINLLSRINEYNKSNFRRVFAAADLELELYELYNSQVHVIFLEIDCGIYLVLGVSLARRNYQKIANRYFQCKNQAFIEEIRTLIKDPNEKAKLLASQVLPDEEIIKRTRKNNKKLDN